MRNSYSNLIICKKLCILIFLILYMLFYTTDIIYKYYTYEIFLDGSGLLNMGYLFLLVTLFLQLYKKKCKIM